MTRIGPALKGDLTGFWRDQSWTQDRDLTKPSRLASGGLEAAGAGILAAPHGAGALVPPPHKNIRNEGKLTGAGLLKLRLPAFVLLYHIGAKRCKASDRQLHATSVEGNCGTPYIAF